MSLKHLAEISTRQPLRYECGTHGTLDEEIVDEARKVLKPVEAGP